MKGCVLQKKCVGVCVCVKEKEKKDGWWQDRRGLYATGWGTFDSPEPSDRDKRQCQQRGLFFRAPGQLGVALVTVDAGP